MSDDIPGTSASACDVGQCLGEVIDGRVAVNVVRHAGDASGRVLQVASLEVQVEGLRRRVLRVDEQGDHATITRSSVDVHTTLHGLPADDRDRAGRVLGSRSRLAHPVRGRARRTPGECPRRPGPVGRLSCRPSLPRDRPEQTAPTAPRCHAGRSGPRASPRGRRRRRGRARGLASAPSVSVSSSDRSRATFRPTVRARRRANRAAGRSVREARAVVFDVID